jgi:hypothetical protein
MTDHRVSRKDNGAAGVRLNGPYINYVAIVVALGIAGTALYQGMKWLGWVP